MDSTGRRMPSSPRWVRNYGRLAFAAAAIDGDCNSAPRTFWFIDAMYHARHVPVHHAPLAWSLCTSQQSPCPIGLVAMYQPAVTMPHWLGCYVPASSHHVPLAWLLCTSQQSPCPIGLVAMYQPAVTMPHWLGRYVPASSHHAPLAWSLCTSQQSPCPIGLVAMF